VTVRRSVPYVLVGLGLVVGVSVLLFRPLPGARLDLLVGAGGLAVAVAGVLSLIVGAGGVDERGPDF